MTVTVPVASAPAPAPSAPGQTRALVGRRVDAWLLGGIGVVAWVLLTGPGPLASVSVPVLGYGIVWVLMALVGTHFGVSYHLAYGQGRVATLQRPVALVLVPAGLVMATISLSVAALAGAEAVARVGVQIGLMAVFTVTGWHYVKQVYGVSRLGVSLRGLSIDPLIGRLLRYGLYPVWFVHALSTWVPGFEDELYGFTSGVQLFPRGALDVMQGIAALSAVGVVACWVVLSLRWKRLVPATMWAPYLAGFLWLTRPPDHASAIVVLGALHAMQYLACAHRAEINWGAERGESRTLVWWTSVFGGALATGMMLSYWAPMWLGWATEGTSIGLLPAAMLFVTFNLHHYAIDAVIWRSRDGHVRRMLGGVVHSRS
ncbi:MAG: hypothetical protein ACXIVQ_09350 [Acidimicrobiales bacterium]